MKTILSFNYIEFSYLFERHRVISFRSPPKIDSWWRSPYLSSYFTLITQLNWSFTDFSRFDSFHRFQKWKRVVRRGTIQLTVAWGNNFSLAELFGKFCVIFSPLIWLLTCACWVAHEFPKITILSFPVLPWIRKMAIKGYWRWEFDDSLVLKNIQHCILYLLHLHYINYRFTLY